MQWYGVFVSFGHPKKLVLYGLKFNDMTTISLLKVDATWISSAPSIFKTQDFIWAVVMVYFSSALGNTDQAMKHKYSKSVQDWNPQLP